MIRFLNPVIRGWGNYFKGGTVKKLYGELDGYIRGRLRSFEAKRRTLGTILYTLPQSELKKMGLISLLLYFDVKRLHGGISAPGINIKRVINVWRLSIAKGAKNAKHSIEIFASFAFFAVKFKMVLHQVCGQ